MGVGPRPGRHAVGVALGLPTTVGEAVAGDARAVVSRTGTASVLVPGEEVQHHLERLGLEVVGDLVFLGVGRVPETSEIAVVAVTRLVKGQVATVGHIATIPRPVGKAHGPRLGRVAVPRLVGRQTTGRAGRAAGAGAAPLPRPRGRALGLPKAVVEVAGLLGLSDGALATDVVAPLAKEPPHKDITGRSLDGGPGPAVVGRPLGPKEGKARPVVEVVELVIVLPVVLLVVAQDGRRAVATGHSKGHAPVPSGDRAFDVAHTTARPTPTKVVANTGDARPGRTVAARPVLLGRQAGLGLTPTRAPKVLDSHVAKRPGVEVRPVAPAGDGHAATGVVDPPI